MFQQIYNIYANEIFIFVIFKIKTFFKNMKSKDRISFYVLYKDFNTGDMIPYDVMKGLYNHIFNENGTFRKKEFHIFDENFKYKSITNKEDLKKFINNHFRYYYWSKCEWEFIVSDWPPTQKNRDKKVDIYDFLKPNIDLITNIVWEQIKDKINDK